MKKLMITVNGKRYEVDVEVIEDDETPDFPPAKKMQPVNSYVTPVKTPVSGPRPKVKTGDAKSLVSPINGVVLEIPVAAGQSVAVNDVLLILEAMKMKTNISSPHAGKIKAINVKVADTIEAGQVLMTFE